MARARTRLFRPGCDMRGGGARRRGLGRGGGAGVGVVLGAFLGAADGVQGVVRKVGEIELDGEFVADGVEDFGGVDGLIGVAGEVFLEPGGDFLA